jgi:hypothetical protein
MRAITAAQQGVLDAGNQAEWVRVQVKDAGGTWRDLTTYPGFNALKSITWTEQIDSPQATFDCELFRELYAFNLSPFVASSPVNKGFNPSGAFSALLDLNRELKIEVAVVPMGMAPSSGDWVQFFTGRIDTLDAASSAKVIKLGGRGMVGRLALQYIKTERVYSFAAVAGVAVSLRVWEPNMPVTNGSGGTELTYVLPASRGWDPATSTGDPGAPGGVPMFLKCATSGTTGTTEPVWTTGAGQADGSAAWDHVGSTSSSGNPVEQVMQNIMDDNRGIGDAAVTLYTPTTPAWAIKEFQQQRTQVLDAIRALAQQIGWDVRPKWRTGTAQFELTFYQPSRSSPSVDFTFAPADYMEPQQLALNIAEIRNHWFLTFSDAGDLWPDGTPKRKLLEVSDSTSITRFGDLIAEIQEDSASQIDSSTEGNDLINAALSDCKDPTAVLQVPLARGFPWVELNDFLKFKANGVQFDSDQSLAVTQYQHTYQGDKPKLFTVLTLRGKPTIGARSWLANIIHPRVPNRDLGKQTGHKRQAFSGTNTPVQSLSLAVGGTHGMIKQSIDKNRPTPEFEVHIYPVSGSALSSSTLYAVTKSISNSFTAGLVPGRTYYMKTVPRWYNDDRS